MGTEEENPDHMLEFLLSDLNERKDRRQLMHLVYEKITQVVGEKDVVGCDFQPFGRAPKKVTIQCKNEQVKDTLLIQGIDLEGCHVNLREPMDSPLRVSILGAPTYVTNVLIRNWLAQYGKIVDFQNEHFNYNGKRTPWRVNTRVALMKSVSDDNKIPPWGKVKYRNRDIEFWTKYDGQNDMKCFSCGECVPKTGHECARQASKKNVCYNCGSTEHFKYNCRFKEKVCHKCKQPGHNMRNCTTLLLTEDNFPSIHASTPKTKRTYNDGVSPTVVSFNADNHGVTSFQVQADVHPAASASEVQSELNVEGEVWEVDRSAKRRRMKAKRRNGSTTESIDGSPTASPPRSRKGSIVSNCSESWDVIDILGEEDALEPKKGPTKDPEINHYLLNRFLQQKVNPDQDGNTDKDVDEREETKEVQEIEMTEDEGDEDFTDAHQEISNPSIFGELHAHEFQLDVTSFGSSNMRDVVMTGDQDLSINFKNHVAKGMRIRETHERLDDLDTDYKSAMPLVVTNVGAADFTHGEDTDLIQLGIDYSDLVQEVRSQCPDSIIVVSSILPRSGKGFGEKECEETNEQILKFNKELKKHCDTLKDVHFVDNYLFVLTPECTVRKELYGDDIHLNQKGKQALSDSIFAVIKGVYFASKLCKELLDVSS